MQRVRWGCVAMTAESASPSTGHHVLVQQRSRLGNRSVTAAVLMFVVGALLSGSSPIWDCSGLMAPIEIFKGVIRGCEQLKPSEEGTGFVHWVAHRSSSSGH